MKIIYAARFDNEGISSNTSQSKGMKKLGHTVISYSTPHRQDAIGFQECDKEIVQMVKTVKPDLLIFAKGTGVNIKVFKECRRYVPVCYWFPDPLVTYNVPEFIEKTKHCDYFCCDKENVLSKAKKYNSNCYLVPDGFDADLEFPKDLKQDIDISFIGSLYNDRRQKIDHIKKEVMVVSDAFGKKHSEIVSRSKINLNFCTTAGASDRTYKVLGAKGFFLSDDWDGREKTFKDGEHIVIFKDLDDLNEKIEYYLNHEEERNRIREAGYKEIQKYTRDEWSRKIIKNFEQEKVKNNFYCQRKKVLIAGPWIGEFGWELCAWQGYIRALSKHFDYTICLGRATSSFLYEDFTNEYITYEATGGLADSFFMHNHDIDHQALHKIFKENNDSNITWVPPKRIGNPPHTLLEEKCLFGNIKIKPEYIKFSNTSAKKQHVVFHARNRELRKDDNWEIENWNNLASLLSKENYKIICIGTTKESLHIKNTEDMRGYNLEKITQILAEAKAIFGPSSGPMHLASLCGCPHVVWSKKTDLVRYATNWNPHKTPVLFLGEYEWRPTPQYVFNQFKKWKMVDREV